ncbi:MAG: HAD-IIB family hydrolase, partial [Streptococcaceae bacterium]|nr:HAD-IIB family hydrolase [Streptococcaceae bacterium]
MTVKMICIDIDGTLLNDKHEVTPAVKQTIQKAKAAGIKVVITTGRPLQGVYALLEELNLMDQGDYVITYNGGVVKEMGSGEEI